MKHDYKIKSFRAAQLVGESKLEVGLVLDKETTNDLKLLLTNLYDASFVGDEHYSQLVLRLVNILGWTKEIQERLWPKKRQ